MEKYARFHQSVPVFSPVLLRVYLILSAGLSGTVRSEPAFSSRSCTVLTRSRLTSSQVFCAWYILQSSRTFLLSSILAIVFSISSLIQMLITARKKRYMMCRKYLSNLSLIRNSPLNTKSEKELERIFRLYGEVENSGRAARLVCAARESSPIMTTGDLEKALDGALPQFARHKALAKIYQALRIEVNQEMRSLEKFLSGAAASLRPGGRLAVITYHSLEDRMVKNFIRSGNVEGKEEKDLFGRIQAPLKALNKKPVVPSEEEIGENTRARSAKLRTAEKKEVQP